MLVRGSCLVARTYRSGLAGTTGFFDNRRGRRPRPRCSLPAEASLVGSDGGICEHDWAYLMATH